MKYMRKHELSTINAKKEEETQWADGVRTIAYASLLPNAKSVSQTIAGRDERESVFRSFANA